MQTCQTLIEEYIRSLGPSNQWIIASRNNKTTIINAFSFDEFYPYHLLRQNNPKQCKEFESRQLYALPNTPKIILIPSMKKSSQEILLLAQKGQFQFQKLLAHYHGQHKNQLQLVLQLLTTVEMLQKKYGYFKLSPEMIRASKGPSLILWINQNEVSNQPQYPILPVFPLNLQKNMSKSKSYNQHRNSPMYVMVRSLFEILTSKIQNNTLLNQIMREEAENLNFQYIKKRICQALKDQSISSCTISTVPSDEKFRRYTEQKKRKIPEFFINRASFNISQKQKATHNLDDSLNKKSMYSFSNNQFKSDANLVPGCLRKVGTTSKITKQKVPLEERKTYFLDIIQKNANFSKKFEENCSLVLENPKLQSQNMRLSTPCEQSLQSLQKDQKPIIFRDSGKTVSTSSAQNFSVHSSGKRFFANFSTNLYEPCQSGSLNKKSQKKMVSTFGKTSIQIQQTNQKNRNSEFRDDCGKDQVRVSEIIEEKSESQNHVSFSPNTRHPSILTVLNNNSNIILSQQSIVSPGSQFYKDIDFILQSGANISRNMQQEFDKSIEGELNKILFD